MNISDEAAEAAARNLAACYGVVDFDGLGEPEREKWLDLISRVARNESCQKTQDCIKVEGHKSECTVLR